MSLNDSGDRTKFETGAVRDLGKGKGRFDLIPPEMLFRLARHYENGAEKYSERNWEKGIPNSRCIDSAMRHLLKYLAGYKDEDHLAAVIWNISTIMHNEKYITKMDDLSEIDWRNDK